MNAPEKINLPDVQASPDQRCLSIQHVGVRGMRYPLQIKGTDGVIQPTVAMVEMTVGLPPEVKGTHMSRFIEILEAQQALALSDLPALLMAMLQRLEAQSGRIEFSFPWFMRKTAPVSGVESLLDYDVKLVVACAANQQARVDIEVTAPVTSLCPCSKKISDYGAHNQRSLIAISAECLDETLSLEALVRMAEEEASCEVFGLLKRPDEKWVTERAYDNPKFVEDLVRDIALRLKADTRIGDWRVSSENFESIHNHSAYAVIEGSNRS